MHDPKSNEIKAVKNRSQGFRRFGQPSAASFVQASLVGDFLLNTSLLHLALVATPVTILAWMRLPVLQCRGTGLMGRLHVSRMRGSRSSRAGGGKAAIEAIVTRAVEGMLASEMWRRRCNVRLTLAKGELAMTRLWLLRLWVIGWAKLRRASCTCLLLHEVLRWPRIIVAITRWSKVERRRDLLPTSLGRSWWRGGRIRRLL